MNKEELKHEILRMYDQLPEDLQEEAYRRIEEMLVNHIKQNGIEVPLNPPDERK